VTLRGFPAVSDPRGVPKDVLVAVQNIRARLQAIEDEVNTLDGLQNALGALEKKLSAATPGGAAADQVLTTWEVGNVVVGTRSTVDFETAGGNLTITGVDDPLNRRVIITISVMGQVATVLELLHATDTSTGAINLVAAVAEALAALDHQSATVALHDSVGESMAAADTVAFLVSTYFEDLAESLAAADSIANPVIGVVVTEALAAADSAAATSSRNDSVAESLAAADTTDATVVSTDPHTISLMHFNGTDGSTTFTDEKGATWTRTAGGGATISTTQSVFGGASARLNGTGEIGTGSPGGGSNAPAGYNFLTGDFTYEFRLRADSTSFAQTVVDSQWLGGVSGNLLRVDINSSGNISVVVRSDDFVVHVFTGSTVLSANTWYAIAIVRTSGTIQTFVNGTSDSSNAYANSLKLSDKAAGYGALNVSVQQFTGYIDEARVSDVSRYSSNYTPASSPFAS
jgi:Concanavalin A-like lectin/glucanases superfamily